MSPLIELIGGAKVYGWGKLDIPPAFESIASNSGPIGNGVSFQSIPGTYTALQLRFNNLRMASGYSTNKNIRIRFNNISTAAQYTSHWVNGNGGAPSAGSYVNDGVATGIFLYDGVAPAGATYGACGIIDIHDYTSTTRNKTVRGFCGYDQNGSGEVALSSGVWINTAAVTRIDVTVAGYADTGTIELYGIKGAA